MKRLKLSAAILLMMGLSLNAIAQKFKVKEGSLDALKNETAFHVEFTYDNMGVGKFDKESDYVKKKTDEYNGKEAGKGDTWAKSWVSDRADRYEPKFRELFDKTAEAVEKADAKYTIIFHTTFIEPGFNSGVIRKNASIDAEIIIVETADKTKKIVVISMDNAPGGQAMGFDFDSGSRISEAYAKAGKSLGKYIK